MALNTFSYRSPLRRSLSIVSALIVSTCRSYWTGQLSRDTGRRGRLPMPSNHVATTSLGDVDSTGDLKKRYEMKGGIRKPDVFINQQIK